ncbi:hypothetical protein B1R32_105142 [Abditibacterium utsteinense]|uniref:Uncharacterized protein n=1 Tax=Abditibacterium utsteinense TaxID=1960156 RepID=A0A2S8SUI5_9BACT|nr:hypothetical protein B1R32_105142 [Abditibacterium utsteinense]
MPEEPSHQPNQPLDPDVITTKELVSLGASLWRIFKGTLEACAFILSNWLIGQLLVVTDQTNQFWAPIINNALSLVAATTILITLGIECLILIQAKFRRLKQGQEVST